MERLGKIKILIVDDSAHMITIIKVILREFGFTDFFDATDAGSAYQTVQSMAPDIIITDFAMTPVDGCHFAKLIRTASDSPNRFVPIIMVTAYAERTKVEQARDAGVTEFCAKPVAATDLYRKICNVINSPRPFVRTSVYFGPDRRRRQQDRVSGVERRKSRQQA